jgi:hypothetical protein
MTNGNALVAQIFFSCRKDLKQLKRDKKFTSRNKVYAVTEIYIY